MNLAEVLGAQPLPPACSLIVTIPARNEEHAIVEALGALATQTVANPVLIIVFANNCNDATASVARKFAKSHSQLQLHVAEAGIAPPADHVGTARKMLMDYAADRFFAAGKLRGIIATTDADTIVAPDWIEKTIREMRRADAVAGFVEIGAAERHILPPPVRELYAQENAFRHIWAELEALVDPLPEDPFPRHCSFVAASFAVTAEMYRRAGGLPDVAALEDRTFLKRSGALTREFASAARSSLTRAGATTLALTVGSEPWLSICIRKAPPAVRYSSKILASYTKTSRDGHHYVAFGANRAAM